MESDNKQAQTEASAREDAAARAAHIERCIRNAGYNPDSFRPDFNALLSPLMDCLRRCCRGMILRGGTGCGKTTFLRALQRMCGPSGVQYIDCSAAADLDYLDWQETPAKLARDAFVILDDLGTDEVVRIYGETRDRIARLILDWDNWPSRYGRYSAMLIVATNLTGDQLADRYGERVMSRLCQLRPVLLYAPDHRRTNA